MAKDHEFMLTTIDNPWNPYTHWDEWFSYDETSGYHTPGLLARLTITTDELSEADQEVAITQAIEEIIRENIYPFYKKISPNDSPVAGS